MNTPREYLSTAYRLSLQTKLGKQTLVFFAAQTVNAALGLATTAVLTRYLSVEEFGAFTFVTSIALFFSIFFDFGVASSVARLCAIERDPETLRRRAGTSFIASALVGIALIACLALFSLVVDHLFRTNVSHLLLLCAPFTLGYPLLEGVTSVCKGTNRIGWLSLITILPRLFTIGGFALLLFSSFTIEWALVVAYLSLLLAALVGAAAFAPRFTSLRDDAGSLMKELREFGRDMYYGRAIDGLTNGIDKMMLTWSHSVIPVGYYSIAQMMATPISLMSRSLGTSAFQRFTDADRIPRSILIGNIVWCCASAVALVLISNLVVPIFFTARFAPAIAVIPYLALGSALAGLNVPYHSFFTAHRQGRTIKIMSITTSLLFVATTVALVPFFSMTGAACAMIAAYGVNIVMNLYYYRAFLQSRRHNENAV